MKFLKRKFIFISFLFPFIIGSIYGQQSDILVTYEVKPRVDLKKKKSAEAQAMVSRAGEVLSDFEFELLFNKNESIFKKTKQLVKDDIHPLMYNLALGFCAGGEIWYTKNGDFNKLISKQDSGATLILTLNENVQWKITKESKNIGKFKVFRATTTRNKGGYTQKIEAWFAPELPYSFGPLGYNGLPGLILEMNRGYVVYRFKEIEEKNINIKPPKGSKRMTFEKYHELLDARVAVIKKRG